MKTQFEQIANSSLFQNFVTLVILLAGAVVGVETYPAMHAAHAPLLNTLNTLILWIFVGEIAVKILAKGDRPLQYFRDGWNCFDFIIVAACFLPFSGQAVTVLRLLRLLRVLKLVRALPKLQILVNALLKSIPSMGYVSLLLGLLFYIYAVAAVFLFSANDPLHFANLQTAMLSLFRIVTLEDWTDIMYINMYGCAEYGYSADSILPCTHSEAMPALGASFFVSFVLIGTMIMLNLFIGVIMTGMDEAREEALALEDEEKLAAGTLPKVGDELAEVEQQLADLQQSLHHVCQRLSRHRSMRPVEMKLQSSSEGLGDTIPPFET